MEREKEAKIAEMSLSRAALDTSVYYDTAQ
jgi:hypothetical protein